MKLLCTLDEHHRLLNQLVKPWNLIQSRISSLNHLYYIENKKDNKFLNIN